MLPTLIRKRIYVFGLVCLLSSQTLVYGQVPGLSPRPAPVLLTWLEGQQRATNSADANNTHATSPVDDNKDRLVVIGALPAEKKAVDGVKDLTSPKIDKLKALIVQESQKVGLVKEIVNGLAFFYNGISDEVLHPILMIVLTILTVGLILLVVFIFVALKQEKFKLFNKLLIVVFFHVMLFIDLLSILYEDREVTTKFFIFSKDVFLVVFSAFIGFFIGILSSLEKLEEKVLP